VFALLVCVFTEVANHHLWLFGIIFWSFYNFYSSQGPGNSVVATRETEAHGLKNELFRLELKSLQTCRIAPTHHTDGYISNSSNSLVGGIMSKIVRSQEFKLALMCWQLVHRRSAWRASWLYKP